MRLVDQFILVGSNISSIESNVNIRIGKLWTAFKLSFIYKSNLTDKRKRDSFQAVTESILLYGCTTWTSLKGIEKKLDWSYSRIQEILDVAPNKSAAAWPNFHFNYRAGEAHTNMSEKCTSLKYGWFFHIALIFWGKVRFRFIYLMAY